MSPDRTSDVLLQIATAVVSDEAVDWERVSGDDAELKRKVDNLRLLQSIGDAHREARKELLELTSSVDETQRLTWGKLQVVHRLGSGAYGDVYRARDPDLGTHVALKLPLEKALGGPGRSQRFLREARQLAKVRHQNVLRVLGAERHDGRIGLWTELIEGQTLEEMLQRSGRLSAAEAKTIGIDLCRALAAVHGAGLIHRDVKTANIIREEGGRTVLLDFSAAERRLPETDSVGEGTTLSGTPLFMAPELFCGKGASVQSDLYSLGVVLYRLVTFDYPVHAVTYDELKQRLIEGELTPLLDKRPDLPRSFVRVVEKALATDPAQRFSSAGEMERALEDREDRPQPAPRRSPRWPMALAVVALAAVLLWIALRPSTPDLSVNAAFYRHQGTTPRRLVEGEQLQMLDQIYLQLEASKDHHTYVINEDQRGRKFVLFPLPGLDLSNPLRADTQYRLPGPRDGVNTDWVVDSSGEIETFLVIVSDEPISEVERLIAELPAAGSGLISIETEEILRGVGGVATRPQVPSDGPAVVPDLSSELANLAAKETGLWVRTYRFRSPVED